MTPIPENLDNLIFVATNDPILIGIESQDIIIRKDVGGYYLVHKEDLTALIKAVNKK